MIFKRTNSTNQDFKYLINFLDAYLKIIDGDEHVFYNKLNQLEPDVNVVICYVNNEPAGCGAFKVVDKTTIEIKRMYIQPECRGKGIASAILSELEKWANELNYTTCILETGNTMQDAISLYKKAGYAITPNYGKYIGVENSICFAKAIA